MDLYPLLARDPYREHLNKRRYSPLPDYLDLSRTVVRSSQNLPSSSTLAIREREGMLVPIRLEGGELEAPTPCRSNLLASKLAESSEMGHSLRLLARSSSGGAFRQRVRFSACSRGEEAVVVFEALGDF
jgi:hypothetical protein